MIHKTPIDSRYLKNQAKQTPKNKKLTLNSRMQTNQILTNDDEVCISRRSNLPLAVPCDPPNSGKSVSHSMFLCLVKYRAVAAFAM